MSQHTPGPWVVFPDTLCVGGPFTPGPADEPGQTTAGVALCGMRLRTREEARANARLVAACPDLLEAAVYFTRRGFDPKEGFRLMKAAIIKAIGQDGYDGLLERREEATVKAKGADK